MAGKGFNLYKRLALFLLMLIVFSHYYCYAQVNLSGNFSSQYKSTGVITIGTDRVTVNDITGFKTNDTVLVIQMQGVAIQTATNYYGFYQEQIGKPGMHEFLIIQDVILPDQIVFRSNIINGYDTRGKVQVVKVPSFNIARVTGKLTVDPWDGTKGGVLALIAGKSLILDADIDVSGSGFAGGAASVGIGSCIFFTGLETYPSTFNNAGWKGEGIAIHDLYYNLLLPANARGKGPNYTGGGGANGRYSGGGGAGNIGEGGRGGSEDKTICGEMDAQYGGSKGQKIGDALAGRIFMGGGGGASTSESGTLGAGGNGGGIIIIITDSLASNGGRILANGNNGADGGTNAGAGGGGAGGAVAISLSKFGSAPLVISASGGKGGNMPVSFGEGGGGGGGLIYINNTIPANVTLQYAGGAAGQLSGTGKATPGTDGKSSSGFIPTLNGFLFNSIRSSSSGNQLDSICFGMNPPYLKGTIPVGGTKPYSYQWQRKTTLESWADITGATSPEYQPVIETNPAIDTVFFRRIVTDNSSTVISDVSKQVKIAIHHLITGNITAADTTICYSQVPDPLVSNGVLAGGNGQYSFKWELSTDDGVNYVDPPNVFNNESYSPGSLKTDTWFRRIAFSGSCIDNGNVIKVVVLDTVKNNGISIPPDICYGMVFQNVAGSTEFTSGNPLSGGDGIYRYKWESNINDAGWTTADVPNILPDYNPAELSERAPFNKYMYRRVVYSGNDDVCSSVSNTITIKDFPVIANNTLSADQAICSGTAPDQITGSTPSGGNGAYKYTWEMGSSSSGPWEPITGFVNSDAASYTHGILTVDTWFRRTVLSSACSNASLPVMIRVHKQILNNSISLLSGTSDTTICNGQLPHSLKGLVPQGGTEIPGDFSFQWMYSVDGQAYLPVPVNSNSQNYSPPVLSATTYYKRKVTSGKCESTSGVVNIYVLPLITNNQVSASQTICINTVPAPLTGGNLQGGNGTYTYLWYQKEGTNNWVEAAGINSNESYSPPALTVPMKYRRLVTSGTCCTSISNEIDILLYPPLPSGTIKNIADTTICGGSKVLLKVALTGSGPWDVTYIQNTLESQAVKATTGSYIFEVIPQVSGAVENFNYVIGKITDVNGCKAVTLTGSKKAVVYKVPDSEAGPDQSVCGPKVVLRATASAGTGQWTFPAFALTSPGSLPDMTAAIDSLSSGPYNTMGRIKGKFYWEETNWQCKDKDSTEITFYRRPDKINAGADTLLHSMDNFFHLVNDPPLAWETGEWTTIQGPGIVDENTISDLGNGLNSFNWKIYNFLNTCYLEDILNIEVTDLEIPEGFSPNDDPDGYNNTFVIKGINHSDQVITLDILNSAGARVFSTSNNNDQEWTDWDGKDSKGEDLPEGTYYYLLKIRSLNTGKTDQRSGYIILKRF